MDPDERIDNLASEIEERSERLLRRLAAIERDLDCKVSDVEYRLEKAERALRDLESKVGRGY